MPPAPRPISREYRIYLALWRKALVTNEPVTIKASNMAMAVAMRQGMYRAIKPFRYGTMIDNQLLQAAEKFVIYLVRPEGATKEFPLKDKTHFIEIRPRLSLAELNGMLNYLDIDEDDLLLESERIPESVKALADKSEASKPTATPFYTRN